ncbi:MAG: MBL fold metallo-hydrolase [Rhodospirillales bacterium]|nr:MBL fold metallo-hydrolase [Rhodospirillales bacterium]
MRVTILGCGGSSGTPSVDHGWGACDPANPRNRRTRPSILVEEGDSRVLVDTSPDLREQLLRTGVNQLDAVLFTHSHADHMHGIDDLRPVNRVVGTPLDVFANAETLEAINRRFGYVLEPWPAGSTAFYRPALVAHTIDHAERFAVGSIPVVVFRQDHGYCDTLGFRFGPIAYSSDAVALPEDAFGLLDGVQVWIIGTLMDKPHPTHADVDKAVGWLKRVGAKRGILTHLSGRLDYATLAARLPEGVEPAYDGMVIDFPS